MGLSFFQIIFNYKLPCNLWKIDDWPPQTDRHVLTPQQKSFWSWIIIRFLNKRTNQICLTKHLRFWNWAKMNSDGMSVTGLNVFHLLKELTTKRIFNYDFIHKPELTIKECHIQKIYMRKALIRWSLNLNHNFGIKIVGKLKNAIMKIIVIYLQKI